MRNWLAVGAVFGFVSAVVGGCSSSNGPATYEDFCAQKAQIVCPPVVGLCSTLPEATCEQTVTGQCEQQAATFVAANRAFTPNNVPNCLQALQVAYNGLNPNSRTVLSWTSLNGTGGTTAPTPGSPNDLCQQVFLGNVAADQPCSTSYDCASGNICGSNGLCGAETDRQKGDGCADPGDLCVDGTVCTAQGRTSICTGGALADEACSDLNPCSPSNECVDKKCKALAAPGQSCAANSDCDPKIQDGNVSDGFCDSSGTKTCASGYTFGNGSPDCSAFGAAVTK